MAEQIIKSRESDPGDYDDDDDDDDVATGIGVVINIGHKCNHLTTSNSATGSHTRNFHLMDGVSNNHVGNDSHNDSTAISGTIYGANLTPHTRNTSEVRARSVPLRSGLAPAQATSDSPGLLDKPSFFLRPPYQESTRRPLSESILFPPYLQEPEIPKPRSNSLSVLARTTSRPVDFPTQNERQWPHPSATYPGHTVVGLAHNLYVDKPPHQDVAIQHIHCEPEASLQTDWIDSQLVGRVIELSAEDTHLHRRAMVVMAISKRVRFLQCLHICRHPEMLRNSAEFYETHVAVFDKRTAEDAPTPTTAASTAVSIDRPEMYALRTHCFINYQHVWTVRRDVIFRNIGSVADFQRLKHEFRGAQRRLYEDD